ncbi:transmembrane protein 272-like [Pelobates fuscus]|uniref:transmembrane protein 272-like n=1 Tax=Pelobates fuscus TaxID=191477 RepID=UPI002FE4C4BA
MAESESPYTPLLQAMQGPLMPKPISVTMKCVVAVIHITSIVLGALFIKDCPGQPLIPYYLIVWGSGSILLLCLTCLPCGDGREPPRISLATLCAQGVLFLFLFSFFIAGNVWIYSLYPESWDSPESPKQCNRVLYLYAFWITTICHICLMLLVLGLLCVFICLCVLKASLNLRSG